MNSNSMCILKHIFQVCYRVVINEQVNDWQDIGEGDAVTPTWVASRHDRFNVDTILSSLRFLQTLEGVRSLRTIPLFATRDTRDFLLKLAWLAGKPYRCAKLLEGLPRPHHVIHPNPSNAMSCSHLNGLVRKTLFLSKKWNFSRKSD